MDPRQVVLIANGRSRRGREAFEAMPQLLRERDVEVTETYFGPTHDDVCVAVRRAIERGERLIVVCGGDGTQTSVVPFFAKRHCALGVVPAGTGNSFALGLGIEDSFEFAADTIAYGRERAVDLGSINGTYFANFTSVGLSAEIAQETSRGLKKVLGAAAYGISSVVPILSHRPFRARIRWKGHRVRLETHQIIIANGRFYGHQPLAPDASLTDGRLTVFVRDATSHINVFQTYLALLRGKQAELSGVHLWSTSGKVKIDTVPKVQVSIDGCAFGKTPLCIRVAPGVLRVITRITSAVLAS